MQTVTVQTRFGSGTPPAVVAGIAVVIDKDAIAGRRIARIVGTTVVIAADLHRAAVTRPLLADVIVGTCISVRAGGGVVHGDATPRVRVADVVRAHISVVRTGQRRARADAAAADIACGTQVAVGAGGGVVHGDAVPGIRIADVVSAHIPVIRTSHGRARADSAAADIACGTRVAVGTGVAVVIHICTNPRRTAIVRALIVVIAIRVLDTLRFRHAGVDNESRSLSGSGEFR